MEQYGIRRGDDGIFAEAQDAYHAWEMLLFEDDQILFREEITVTYRGEPHVVWGPWVRAHCKCCQAVTDLAPMFGVDETKLSCAHCWGEIHEAVEGEIRWQRRHNDAEQRHHDTTAIQGAGSGE